MNVAHPTEASQSTLWNGLAGQGWVAAQALLDRMFKPLEALLVDAIAAGSGGQVLDVGCGTGGTTRALAARLGVTGHCVGIDISAPMIAAAGASGEREGGQTRYIVADAQRHDFAAASYDSIVSRFGVMFFDDPVHAFANLRHAARDGAGLHFLAWRSPAENPFMTAAERAAAPLLPGLPRHEPEAPGQFAFADAIRVRRILEQSGWTDIAIQAIDVPCRLPEPDLIAYLSQLGPVGRALQQVDAPTRRQVLARVRRAFEPYVRDAEVRYDAACWSVVASAG